MSLASPSPGPVILVVEDDPGISELICGVLEGLGWNSLQACSGTEAVVLITKHNPYLVLLDYSLPDMTGLELLDRIASMPPFIIITGAGDERIAVSLMKHGARDYLVKGAQFLDVLPNAVSRVLREIDTEHKLKETERILEERSQRLELVLEGTNDAFWDWDLESGAIFYSDRWFDMFGYRRKDFEPSIAVWEEHLHPEDRAPTFIAIRNHLEGKTAVYQSEHRLRTKSGDYLWVQGRGKVVALDDKGKPLRMAGMITDITNRKQFEAELRKLTAAVEQSPAAIVITNLEGNIEYVNPAFCRHTGYTFEEAFGKNPRILKSGEQPPEVYKELWETISQGGTWRGEFHNKKKNGELFWEMVVIGPILNNEGRVTNYLAVKEDITERKWSEEALRRAQKLESLGVMAGGIAHDFNNLFTAVLGNVDIAELSLPQEAAVRAQLQVIRSAISRATNLSKQMLAFSGMGRFIPDQLDLNLVLAEVKTTLRSTLPDKIGLTVESTPELPIVEGDERQIQQLIECLITNAAEAMDEKGGEIRIITRHEELQSLPVGAQFPGLPFVSGQYSVIEVRDTGCGIAPDVMSKIFDPFFSTKFAGRGLSLAASLGILRSHNAGIRVESRVGAGSIFTIYFPGVSVTSLHTPQVLPPEPDHASKPKRILVVDDEEVLRESTAELLRTLGYEVIEAENGADALAQFKANPGEIGLVIMDLTMPRMDGKEAFLAMKHVKPDANIVLSSGYSEHEVTGSIRDKGLAGFLQKPYQFKELKDLVEKLMGK